MRSIFVVTVLLLFAITASGCNKNLPSEPPPPVPVTKEFVAPKTPSAEKVAPEPEPATDPVALAAAPEPAPAPKIVSHRRPAPGFTLRALDGKEYSLSSLRGQVVVLTFWSTTCPHCLNEMPGLNRFARTMEGQPLKVVTVAFGREDAIRAKVRQLGVDLPVMLDPGYKVADRYQVEYVPATFIIDAGGGIAKTEVGELDWTSRKMVNLINKLIEESK